MLSKPSLKTGDRVRLRASVAKKLTDRRVNWTTRQGTVQHMTKVTDDVFVKWDDRITPDHWPIRALEKIP